MILLTIVDLRTVIPHINNNNNEKTCLADRNKIVSYIRILLNNCQSHGCSMSATSKVRS